MTQQRPPFDPELGRLLADMPLVAELNTEVLAQIRPFSSVPVLPALAGRAVDQREVGIARPDGTQLELRRSLGTRFDEVVAGRTVWANVPPAFVYFCRRPRVPAPQHALIPA